MKKSTHIVIIDDSPVFREGVRSVLNRDDRYCIVGETGTLEDGIKLIEELKPDLILMELWLQDQNAMNDIRHIKKRFPKLVIMILSAYRELNYIVQTFMAGVSGFVLKESNISKLFKGLEAVLSGDRYLDESISSVSIMRLMSAETLRKKSSSPNADLTAREKEVTRLLAEGIPRKEIANMLYISPKTVENHISRTMKKLCLRNSIELTLWAAKLGLINPEEWRGGPLRRYQGGESNDPYQDAVR